MGSTTYEWILEHDRRGQGSCRVEVAVRASPAGSSRSRQLEVVPEAPIEFVSGEVAPVHAEMVAAAGGRNVWIVGGGDLAGQFADAGLLDEVIVYSRR